MQPGETIGIAFSGANDQTPVVLTGGTGLVQSIDVNLDVGSIDSEATQEVGRSTFGNEATQQVVNNTGHVQYVFDGLGELQRIAPGETKEITVLEGLVQVADETYGPFGDAIDTTGASVVTLYANLEDGSVQISSGNTLAEAQPENKRTKILQNLSKRAVQFVAAALRRTIPSQASEVIEYVATTEEQLKSYQIIQK